MRRRNIGLLASAAMLVIGAAAAQAQSQVWPSFGGQGGSPCATFGTISETFTAAAGATNGIVGTPQPGETYTVTVTGPGTGTFRIVGDGGGVVTYAGPTSVPGSLSVTFTGGPAPGAIGVGYFFDTGAGTVTLTATCSVFQSVPANDRTALVLLVVLGGLAGLIALRLRS